ncbi:MAG: carboxypeptidase regulatory-like domain-containing protein [Verrucomicrobia bacterium]|nr:carboxypeptidase regulatory-like domain-containing protein [Verrucomicrobiota bacterium]
MFCFLAGGRLSANAQPKTPDRIPKASAFELTASTVVQGKVTDASGQPLGGVIVRLEQDGWEIARTNTSPAGDYQLSVEPSDKPYSLLLKQTDFVPVRTNFVIRAGDKLKADFALQDDTSIVGTVLALDNSPLNSVVVQAIRVDTNAAANSGAARVTPSEKVGRGVPTAPPAGSLGTASPTTDTISTVEDRGEGPVQPGLMGEYFQSATTVVDFAKSETLVRPPCGVWTANSISSRATARSPEQS